MQKLLIATTNEGKLKEMKHFLDDLPFEILSLKDLDNVPEEPEETEPTILGNAILKAKYYGKKTGLLTLADDGGLFIDALGSWPGVISARIASDSDGQCALALEKMKNETNRNASFRLNLALYEPVSKNLFISEGKTDGKITTEVFLEEEQIHSKYGFNRIFFLEDIQKTYSQLTTPEKNAVSHRGKALSKIKYILQNEFGTKHIVVPFALIIKDGKLLMTRRNDPHRPDYHNKWEFPGGSMEFGETLEENVVREAKEEAGYNVEIIKKLSHIGVENQDFPTFKYQVYLIPFVCKIVGGDGVYNDAETLGSEWFELEDVLNQEMIGENVRMFEVFQSQLRGVIKKNNL